MIPIEKAKELIQNFRSEIYKGIMTPANLDLSREKYRDEQGARCALLCVDGIIKGIKSIAGSEKHMYTENEKDTIEYWKQVKFDIISLLA